MNEGERERSERGGEVERALPCHQYFSLVGLIPQSQCICKRGLIPHELNPSSSGIDPSWTSKGVLGDCFKNEVQGKIDQEK